MSSEDLKKYKLDEAKEFSFLGSSLIRLSSAISASLIVSDHALYAIITVGLGWLGYEVQEYFKLHENAEKKTEDK